MTFEKVRSEKLAQTIVRQIELLILRGILHSGERLPSERDLAEMMGVSRPSLREAIADLQDRGLLVARLGSGIYVDEVLRPAFSPALARLFATHAEAVFDYVAFRRDIEGLTAERAARLASDTDLMVVATIFAKMEAAHAARDAEAEAALDAEFHLAIIEAGHNILMLQTMRSMYQMLRDGVFSNRQVMFRQNATRQDLLDQHRAIHAALQARDPGAARRAVEVHLDYVEAALIAQQKSDRKEAVARQRLDQELQRG